MTLLEQLKQSIDTMSLGERLVASLQVALLGVTIVFAALILLFLIIKILEHFVSQSSARSERKAAAAAAATAGESPAPATPASEPAETGTSAPETDDALIAVISAAVAASQEETSTHQLVVRDIRRRVDTDPAWGRLGRIQQVHQTPRPR